MNKRKSRHRKQSPQSHPSRRKLLFGAVAFSTFSMWLVFAIVFGGLGGHMFPSLSKSEFLVNSQNSYFESHEAMIASKKASKEAQKLARIRYMVERGEGPGRSRYRGEKNGRLIFEEEALLKSLANEIEAEIRRRGIDPNDSDAIAKVRKAIIDAKLLKRAEVLELLELKTEKLKDLKAGKDLRIRADSDQDLNEELDSLKAQVKLDADGESDADNQNVDSGSQRNTTVANSVRIEFLDDTCGTMGDEFKATPVEYRKGSAAIKGSSLDSLDVLIKLARTCGEVRLSVIPTKTGLDEDVETDRNLMALRNAEVKYYLLQRQVPKDFIALFDAPI